MILSGKFKVTKLCSVNTVPFSKMIVGDEFRVDIPAFGPHLGSGKSSALTVQISYKDDQYLITGGKVLTAIRSMGVSQVPFYK